jgi:glutamate racemase
MSARAPVSDTVTSPIQQGLHRRIGVFDSGLGGLSVLRALRQYLPLADMLYVADSGHAPYGEKDTGDIIARSEYITDFLLAQGAQAIVIACNTATAAAAQHLRTRWPDVPIVGVEPGVKPAVAHSPSGRIGVLATPGTLASPKFQQLVERHGRNAEITLQACPGLAKEIESGELDTPRLRDLVTQFARPLQEAHSDTIVLGCTHYPFVRPLFEQVLGPEVRIIDTSDAVARHVAHLVTELPACTPQSAGGDIRFWSSGNPTLLSQIVQRWFHLKTEVQALP